MKKLQELEEVAKAELRADAEKLATERIKERLREIAHAKRVLATLEEQYQTLLAKDVVDFIPDTRG